MSETVGALLGWISSLLTADPLMLLMCSSFVGSFLQGVAHEITGEKATLPQLEDFADEIGHTTFFPHPNSRKRKNKRMQGWVEKAEEEVRVLEIRAAEAEQRRQTSEAAAASCRPGRVARNSTNCSRDESVV